MQEAHLIFSTKSIAMRSFHVYHLLQIPMKKGILHVKLKQGSILQYSYSELGTNRGHLSNMSKSLVVIHPMLLCIAKSNKPSSVAFDRTVRSHLDGINPSTANSRRTGIGTINNRPSFICLQCTKLVVHGAVPYRIVVGLFEDGGNN
ncbi:unnamed protein product [Linum trigynum]|uniref:Uncharacterized protein n=1 Tax=Linum trigynum TaxID=586398 RepID=A0AAV2DUZ2_9ROSI